MAPQYLNNIVPESAYYRSYSSSSQVMVSIDTSTINPLEFVMNYMLEEIKAIRETRQTLKKQYPELFSLYAC
jgi:hypothetical protein